MDSKIHLTSPGSCFKTPYSIITTPDMCMRVGHEASSVKAKGRSSGIAEGSKEEGDAKGARVFIAISPASE